MRDSFVMKRRPNHTTPGPTQRARAFVQRPDAQFLIKLAAFNVVGNVLITYVVRQGGWPALQSFYAVTTAGLLGLFGVAASVEGHSIALPDSALGGMHIVFGCTGVLEVVTFASGVFALPCGARQKVVGYLGGLFLAAALNWIRLLALATIDIYAPRWHDVAHAIWMQGFLIVCIIPGWIAWAVWARRASGTES